ncbi:MAG TPA: phosphoglycerate kinase [Alphaproteobacteria bacterium]|jgi:phosphoglycerate kinase|nr:phosphoglycerate kinase [Alphaproteobacteria bacterium]
MTEFKTIDDIDVAGKRVLVRVDLNVPIKDGRVTDATRIVRLTPTLDELAKRGARLVLLSHFGRPKGKVAADMSLRPVVAPLAQALERPVAFAEDCIGPKAEQAVAALKDGQVVLLENLRFHAGEEDNDPAFAKRLAALGDVYVNDAFSAAHRAHASTEALARLLPAAAGRLMQAELEALARALTSPARPVAAIVGGAKISTKLDLLGNLVAKVDVLAIGGGMANTFLHATGTAVGRSLCEPDMAATVKDVMARAKEKGCAIVLPVDAVVAREFKANAPHETVAVDKVPADAMILDLGPRSIAALEAKLAECRTCVWNGPLGAFEMPPFQAGTVAVARTAARLTKAGKLLTVAGGGDTVAALAEAGAVDDFSYVSTAGGAFLEWLEGKDLPGVAALRAAAGRAK